MTERVTCRREAPSARNRASSRVRWATMIEKVFRIRKVPTTSATAANTSRKVVMKTGPVAVWSLLLAGDLPVVERPKPGRQHRGHLVAQLLVGMTRRGDGEPL